MKKIHYPVYDSSDWKPTLVKDNTDGYHDWDLNMILFSDGRPCLRHGYSGYYHTFEAYYYSTFGIEDYTDEDLQFLIAEEDDLEFDEKTWATRSVTGINLDSKKIIDKNGNEFWHCIITIGNDDSTFVRKKHRRKNEIKLLSEYQIYHKYMDDVLLEIANKIINQLEQKEIKFFEQDSGLKNLWEEVCVQVQMGIDFELKKYKDIIYPLVREQTDKMNDNLKELIWFALEINWSATNEEGYIGIDIAETLFEQLIIPTADTYKNQRIEHFLFR